MNMTRITHSKSRSKRRSLDGGAYEEEAGEGVTRRKEAHEISVEDPTSGNA